MVMVFEGDVLHGQICTMVKWPVMAFQQAANGGALQVPTPANLDALFDADPTLELVGPFVVNKPGTELIWTRNVMFVPPKYGLILLGQLLKPAHQAYTSMGGAIHADGLEVACASLINFL